jgi:hypothetical protein
MLESLSVMRGASELGGFKTEKSLKHATQDVYYNQNQKNFF